MCLIINNGFCTFKSGPNHQAKDKHGLKFGYKVIYNDGYPIFFGRGNAYKVGWNISNRKRKNLIRRERLSNKVYKGIHIYLKYRDAKLDSYCEGMKIIKVWYDPADVVAYGNNSFGSDHTVVAMRVKIKSLKGI